MNESNTTQIEGYGSMVCDAMNVDCTPLVSCLDSILKTFEDYLRLLETVRVKPSNPFVTHLSPINCFHFFLINNSKKSEIEMIAFQTSLNPVIEEKQNELMKSYRKIDDLEVF